MDFDLDGFLAAGGHEVGEVKLITLNARITYNLATTLRETPLTPSMSLVAEGKHFLVEADIRDNLALHRRVLRHARAIEILAPSGLRKSIATQLLAATGAYA